MKNLNKKIYTGILALLIFTVAVPESYAQQVILPGFNPEKIIEDKIFSDTQTFGGPDGIQKFLETKGSVLANTSPEFLVKLKEPEAILLKQGLEDPQPNLSRLRTAAELIWDASKHSGLNPQVLLVTMNKEQGLITAAQTYEPAKLQRALDFALGFGCPDSTGCSSSMYPGFYFQLFGNFDSSGNRYLGAAKSLMKSFTTPGGRGPSINGRTSKVGEVITLENTMGGYEGIMPQQSFTIGNLATAALYRFTPHVFNGNYNFWKFFQEWFKYPNGTILKLATGVDNYIIQNGVKQLLPTFVAQARNLDLNNSIIVSPSEFEGYQTDKVLGPSDNTLVSVIGEGTKFVFLKNIKHPVSDFVIKQRGLDPLKVLSVSAQESALFEQGNVLPPNDGTIIRGTADQTVYQVVDGKIKMFSEYTFKQRAIKPKLVVTVPDTEITTYEKSGFMPPLDGSLVKASGTNTVYLIENGMRREVLGDIFKINGYKASKVASLSTEEITGLTIGAYATPKDRTFFSAGTKGGPFYMFKEGTKHSISAYVAKSRKLTPDYVFPETVAGQWFEGIPVPPADNTVVKGDGDGTVFLVVKGQLRPLTAKAFAKRKISAKKIVTLPQAEVDSYAKGETIEK